VRFRIDALIKLDKTMRFRKLAISFAAGILVLLSACTTTDGESKMAVGGNPTYRAGPDSDVNDDLANALARVEMAEAEAQTARAEAQAAKAALRSGGDNNALFPPDAVPGRCYARVLIPAIFEEQTEEVLVKAESTRIEVTQAEYEWVTEQKLVREASSRIEIIPAEYKTVTEKVMVKPETTRLISVPAQFEQVTEQVMDVPAHTEWRRGNDGRRIEATRPDVSGGDVVRMVEVPASYKTITRTMQVTQPTVKEVIEPAEYKTVSKTVVVTPASSREITIPAQYTQVRKLHMVKPGESIEVKVPAEYKTITKRVKVGDQSLEWREVLCESDLTPQFVQALQRKLLQEGYFDSPVDGIYQRLTQNGINRYAENNGLPYGSDYLTVEIANALGLSY